jgi:hypothetical protein
LLHSLTLRLIKEADETDLTTDPTSDDKDYADSDLASEGREIYPTQKADKASDPQREPTPIEFVAGLRELFREIKKLIVFIRHRQNLNAALVVLTLTLAIATFTQAIIYGIQLGPLRRSADAAKNSADISKKYVRDGETHSGKTR